MLYDIILRKNVNICFTHLNVVTAQDKYHHSVPAYLCASIGPQW